MASDDFEDEENDSDGEGSVEAIGNDGDRAELRKLMGQGQKHMAVSLSQAAKADVEKGMAVRQQRKTFDTMLNVRIRLQKALVAANSFETASIGADSAEEPYLAAEEAAIKLLDTILGLHTEASHSDGKRKKKESKRKRKLVTEMSNQEIWDVLQSSQEAATSKRRRVLDKWSTRVSQTATQPTVRKLGPTTRPQSLISILDEQLAGMDRLVKRTRTPRSCAPVQAAKKVQEDAGIYDDADFYQLLLKELVDQRAGDSSSAPGGGSLPTVSWAAIKEARTRKEVDRKASKGRKLRFNVHETLQNFMAPEDRGTWEQDATDRFFRGLFGRKAGGEEEADGIDGELERDDEMADSHLRLFGS
jgi:protein AATF/BFR2